MLAARRGHADPVPAILGATDGVALLRGRIVDLERRLTAGFARGLLRHVLATVPDLISLVDEESGDPVTTEIVRYGLRVVLAMPAPAQLKTADALRVVGPAAFDYDTPYTLLPGVRGGPVLPAT